MTKIFRTLLTAVASIALALGFAVSPAQAAAVFDNNPTTGITISGTPAVGFVLTANKPTYSWTNTSINYTWLRCTSPTTAIYNDSDPLDYASSTFGCQPLGGGGSTRTVVSADVGKYLTVTITMDDIVSGAPDATNYGKSLAESVLATATAAPTPTPTPTPSPSASATPTPTASAAPAKGTAAALAALPKSTTQPKLKFDSSANGLGKSARKALKKVADVAKDGYGVRVTGAAGMQPGVSREAVRALARERAREIRAYLIKQGVPKEDIVIRTKVFPIGKAPATLVKVETIN